MNKKASKEKDQLSKILARAETLKKIARQRTVSKRLETEEKEGNNDDILDDEYLQKLTEKVKRRMKFTET